MSVNHTVVFFVCVLVCSHSRAVAAWPRSLCGCIGSRRWVMFSRRTCALLVTVLDKEPSFFVCLSVVTPSPNQHPGRASVQNEGSRCKICIRWLISDFWLLSQKHLPSNSDAKRRDLVGLHCGDCYCTVRICNKCNEDIFQHWTIATSDWSRFASNSTIHWLGENVLNSSTPVKQLKNSIYLLWKLEKLNTIIYKTMETVYRP